MGTPYFRLSTVFMSVSSDWEKIQTPDADQIISYDQLPKIADPGVLSKLAILKFNGGLGTSMGTYIVPSYSCMHSPNGFE